MLLVPKGCLGKEELRKEEGYGVCREVSEIRYWSALCSQIFCDFGEDFTVIDRDGEQPVSVLISSVTKVTISVCCFVLVSKFFPLRILKEW